MNLKQHLKEKKTEILKQWFDFVAGTYPDETSTFLKKKKAQFTNPVGFTLEEGLDHLFDALRSLTPRLHVLVPDYNSGNEVLALRAAGATLHFYRIGRDMQPDLDDIQRLCREHDPEVLYVIHYLGWPQPLLPLQQLCLDRSMLLVEDCALSLLSQPDGRPLGSTGDWSIFCLYKTLPLPHGGVLAWNLDAAGLPPEPAVPDGKSTAVYLAHRLLDSFELSWSPWGGDRLVAGLRSLGSAVKSGSGTKTVAIDTDHFELRFADLGVSPAARALLDRVDAAEVVRRRRENFARLRDALMRRIGARSRPDTKAAREIPRGTRPENQR